MRRSARKRVKHECDAGRYRPFHGLCGQAAERLLVLDRRPLARGGNRKWYGSFRLGKRVVRAHRFACDVLGDSPCPDGFHRDHTCCFSLCVNPAHLEPVSREENQARKVSRRLA